MKVWEKINEMKGSSVGKETILNWMVCNKICPLDVMEALGESYDRNFQAFGERHCDQYNDCSPKCYEAFLDKEYAVALNIGDMKPSPANPLISVYVEGKNIEAVPPVRPEPTIGEMTLRELVNAICDEMKRRG